MAKDAGRSGRGDDTFFANNNIFDRIDGAAGNDTATIDELIDRVFNTETVNV
jgi:hypothetical protein